MLIIFLLDISKSQTKVKSQALSYKSDTELTIICFVNKAQVMFLFKFEILKKKFQGMTRPKMNDKR